MNLYLLRHGETDWNLEGRLQGHKNIPMNQTGISQINKTAQSLASLSPGIEVILTSPLSRAAQSAQIVAEQLNYPTEHIIIEDILTERSFGLCEGLTSIERITKFGPDSFPEIESIDHLYARGLMAFQKFATQYRRQNILAASHGALLKAMISAITNGKIKYYDETQVHIEPASVFLVKCEDRNIELYKLSSQTRKWHNIII